MHLIEGEWYFLPDGKPVQAHAVGTPPDWYLLTDPGGVTCYGSYSFGLRQFVFDQELGEYRGVSCELTLTDLRPAEWNAGTLWLERTAPTYVLDNRARRRHRPRV
jgi:hypothetical protein